MRFYAVGTDFLRVWFIGGDGYEYDYDKPGRGHVEEMKRLAEAGRGLATYISRYVRENFARKLPPAEA